jgi:hypothetical protein
MELWQGNGDKGMSTLNQRECYRNLGMDARYALCSHPGRNVILIDLLVAEAA